MTKERKVYLDILRIIAAFFVVYNHQVAYHAYLNFDLSVWKLLLYLPLSMLTKIAVPLFFMVSGIVLLGKSERTIDLIKKRVVRIVLVILIINAVMYFSALFVKYTGSFGGKLSFVAYVRGMLNLNYNGYSKTYWYLWSYLSFLLMLPLLRKIAAQMKKSDFFLIVILHVILNSIIPISFLILKYLGINGMTVPSYLSVPLATSSAIFYPLIGYYIDKQDISAATSKHSIYLLIVFLSSITVTFLCVMLDKKISGTYSQNYIRLFDYALAITVFLFIKKAATVSVPSLSKGKKSAVICTVGGLTFGIYLLDPIFKTLFYNNLYAKIIDVYVSPVFFKSFSWCFLSMLAGGLITLALKKIPGIKKLI